MFTHVRTVSLIFALIAAAVCAGSAHARPTPLTTAFTYQGQLKQGANPFNGSVDLQFKLFDADSGGNQVGSTQFANAVAITNGVFSVSLDFTTIPPAPPVFDGNERWLEVGVNSTPNGGAGPFTTLSPRQKLSAAPYALFALNATLPATYGGAVNFSNAGNAFTGDGAGLTNLNAANLGGTIGGSLLGGTYANALTLSNAANSFSGSGAALTGLNASNIASGTLADARLSANVALLNNTQTVTGAKTFSNASNSFTGSGTGLTSLNASNLASGAVADARLSTNVALLNNTQTIAGAKTFSSASNSFTGNGAGLTSLNAGNIASGALDVARLPTGGAWALSSPLSIDSNTLVVDAANNRVGIGTSTPTAPLHVFDGSAGVTASASSSLVVESSAFNYLSMLAPDGFQSGLLFGRPTGGNLVAAILFHHPSTPDGLQFYTGTVVHAALTASGNLGIGVTAPTARLTVNQTAAAPIAQFQDNGVAALTIADGGKVGIGTTTPDAALAVQVATGNTLHVLDGSAQTALLVDAAGHTRVGPAISGEQPAVALTVAEDDFVHITGSVITGGAIAVRSQTLPSALRIDVDDIQGAAGVSGATDLSLQRLGGKVGIGRFPTTNKLEVEGQASKAVAGSWVANSDRRIKTDIRDLHDALEIIDRVRPVAFRYTSEYRAAHPSIADQDYFNVIAQEFSRVFPEYVQDSGEKLPGGEHILQVDTYPMLICSVAAVQQLHHMLRDQESHVAALQQQNAELSERLGALEQMVQKLMDKEEHR